MKLTSIHLGLGLAVLVLASVITTTRLQEWRRSGLPLAGSPQPFCIGITHPQVGQGLVCASGPGQLMAAAVESLGLPEDCLGLSLPAPLRPGDGVVLDEHNGSCVFKRMGRVPGAIRLLCGRGIDINTSRVEELELLPNIGPVRAQAIIDARQARGPFRQPSDLARVRGIGPKTIDKLAPFLEWPSAPTLGQSN